MTVFTKEQVEGMTRKDLRASAKKVGIKYGQLSLMQLREALVDYKPSKKVEKEDRKKRSNTKMQLAVDLYTKNVDASRKEIIELFISKAKLTKAGSATYYSLIKQKLKKG
jgi:hypothetical protein